MPKQEPGGTRYFSLQPSEMAIFRGACNIYSGYLAAVKPSAEVDALDWLSFTGPMSAFRPATMYNVEKSFSAFP